MAEITASLVKELRDKTGAGMMDCKAALAETAGDLEAAVDWLRKKGISKAAKKTSRVTAEGLIATASSADNRVGVLVEVNAETDFVARNDQFQAFSSKVAELAVSSGADSIEALAQAQYGNGKNTQETLTEMIATIGENMGLRRMARLEVGSGVVSAYIHSALAPNLGKIGVLVALESTGDQAQLAALGKQLAMHIAAANPEYLNPELVPVEALNREKDVLREQALASGKPAEIVEKMLEGRVRKYYEEVCFLEQAFIMDGETKVSKVVENAAKDVGAPVKVTGFVRFVLGEGIEKEETDFAAEVAAAAGI